MRSLPSPVYKRGNGKSFQMSQYPIHDREQGLAPPARFLQKRATGAPKNLYRQARTAHQLICAMAVVGLVGVGLLVAG
jgi:hypothetical protein